MRLCVQDAVVILKGQPLPMIQKCIKVLEQNGQHVLDDTLVGRLASPHYLMKSAVMDCWLEGGNELGLVALTPKQFIDKFGKEIKW